MEFIEEDVHHLNPEHVYVNNKSVFISGATAGLAVDIAFYPIDTIKTRLQSQYGFIKSGGFTGLFNKGLKPVILGSAPSAALFFVAYENVKKGIEPHVTTGLHPFVHMTAASLGEIAACLIRVPIEVAKQRKQIFLLETNTLGLKVLYRGYWTTVLRDIPFSLIQYPLWEYFQSLWKSYAKREITSMETAYCGAIAGGISAAVTTPLDVVKTRIMTANKTSPPSKVTFSRISSTIYNENGVKGFFAGFTPRVVMITFGGFVYFGIYNRMKTLMRMYPEGGGD